jgi:hypothetical protein
MRWKLDTQTPERGKSERGGSAENIGMSEVKNDVDTEACVRVPHTPTKSRVCYGTWRSLCVATALDWSGWQIDTA